jgi:lipoprotein-anchoring transpeptidase ErfK/SrfK
MKKNIALMIVILFITSASLSNEMPDLCRSGAFTCHQISPNSVVAYPVQNPQSYQQKKVSLTNDIDDSIDKGLHNGKDVIEVDLSNLTWQAYDNNGELIRSGRVSGGKDYCPDIGRECETITGTFTIYRKGGENCKSTIFPVGRGGAPMPYCMFFHGGYALHGSNSVPDYNASHGCVRMSPDDAQWLNEDFVQEGVTQVYAHY